MASKAEKEAAYTAGRANLSEPGGRVGPDACPFPVGSEERAEWLRGLKEALDERPDPAELRQALREAS